jgi:hypothetical protein
VIVWLSVNEWMNEWIEIEIECEFVKERGC